jgi:transposase-like protein
VGIGGWSPRSGFWELSWEVLLAHEEQIRAWVKGGEIDGHKQESLSIVKIEELLARQGVVVPYRTLHRFAVERCGFRVRNITVRLAEASRGWNVSSTSASSAVARP